MNTSQAAFEKWAEDDGFCIVRKSNGKQYVFPVTEYAWHSWQEAMRQSVPDDEQQAAWLTVCDTLTRCFPQWHMLAETREKCAKAAIEILASHYVRTIEAGQVKEPTT